MQILIRAAKSLASVAFVIGCLAFQSAAWAWGDAGHQIVAYVAADHLTADARAHIAQILGVKPTPGAVAAAMAQVSILPDHLYRTEDRDTESWHFIDLCVQDRRADMAARCPNGNCVTAKLDAYRSRLLSADYDRWGALGDLAFVIHLMGDLYQPLHDATNADRGGNCVPVDSAPRARNLHSAWDNAAVFELEDRIDRGRPRSTASRLEKLYPLRPGQFTWGPGRAAEIAWQTHELALAAIYRPLEIPTEPCNLLACQNAMGHVVKLDSAYMTRAADVAGRQLADAGYSLAALLNGLWPGN